MTRIGICCEYLPGNGDRSPCATLEAAKREGLDGVAFPSAYVVSDTLSDDELRAVRDRAEGLGLYLEVGIGMVAAASGPVDLEHVEAAFEACLLMGCAEITAYTTLDRFNRSRSFDQQLASVVD